MRSQQRLRPPVEQEQALRPVDPHVAVEIRAPSPEARDDGVAALVDGERRAEEAQPQRDQGQQQAADPHREQAAFTRTRVALLVGGYLLGLGAMVGTRGLYLTPDRYFLILLVPALALGVARRYVVDFAPFIALMILYELCRGLAHVVRPNPYYAPQLDIDRFLFAGNVPTLWLQAHLWDGHVSWWEAGLTLVSRLHFIVPPTLLFVVWLKRRDLYYRFALTILGVSFAAALTFALWPAAPPWMAWRDGWIPKGVRIGEQNVTSSPIGSSDHSWIAQHVMDQFRNASAAVPSLHAGYSTLVVLFCFALGRRAGLVAIPYALAMWFTIVYFGEHYVSDALIGCAFACIGFVLVGKLWRRSPLAGPFRPPLASARGAPPLQ